MPPSANERPGRAVALSAVYTAEVRANVAGGLRRGARYLDNIDLQLSADLARLLGWRGARLFVYGGNNNGGARAATLVGDTQYISNIETNTRAARLFEAWVEQDLGPRASFRFGLYNLNAEFDTTESGGLFLNSSHGIGPDISQSGENGPSIFPVTSLAARGEIAVGRRWRLRAAVLDGVPGDPARPRRTVVKLPARDGALVVGEADWRGARTKLAAGAWGYSARFDVLGAAPARTGSGNGGGYALVEHRLTGRLGDAPRGLAGWARVGFADTRYNGVAGYVGGGLVHAGPLRGRADDQLGVSVAVAAFSDRYRRALAAESGAGAAARETVIEIAYRAALAPWLSVQPDAQLVLAPGGDRRLRDAFVLGLRVKAGR